MAAMTQEQLDRRIAELGGSGLEYTPVATKHRMKNPKFTAAEAAKAAAGDEEQDDAE